MAEAYRRSTQVPGLRLRPIENADAALLRSVFVSSRAAEFEALPLEGAQKEALVTQQFEAQHAQYQANYAGASFDIIEHSKDGTGVGRLYVDRNDSELHLIEITLVPVLRGQGVGTALITELLQEARAERKSCKLQVVAHNPARRLYQRLGFAEETEDGTAYIAMRWSPDAD